MVYAYSYWFYQVVVAALFDAGGPIAVVSLRVGLVIGTLAVGCGIAKKLGAPLWTVAASLCLAILIAHERFVDRPDLVSHLLLVASLAVLQLGRNDRRVWALLPIQVCWVNCHPFFSLLPALVLCYVAAEFIDGKRDLRRYAGLLAAVLLASCLNPRGPAVWESQVALIRFASAHSLPFPVMEMVSPYAPANPFFALWVFRFALPVTLLLLLAARRELGWGALLGAAMVAVLGASTRRGMSLYAVTMLGFLPLALTRLVGGLHPGGRSRVAGISLGLVAVLGLGAIGGLLSGRIYLAQDKSMKIGSLSEVQFPALQASRFLHDAGVVGPLFHNPESAGALLMANGTRLVPFLDARWLGTKESIAAYHELTQATDQTIEQTWGGIVARFPFEAVMLDFYAMPALLRHLDASSSWTPVYHDAGAIVFLRNDGPNREVVVSRGEREEPGAVVPPRDSLDRLGEAVTGALQRGAPSWLTPVSFPWTDFYSANLAMQRRHRGDAVEAYSRLYAAENGTLRLSAHRRDVLNNTLWCLTGSNQARALAGLAAALVPDEPDPARRRSLTLLQAQSLNALSETSAARALAESVLTDPLATVSDRWWGWFTVAESKRASSDFTGAVNALRSAAELFPQEPTVHRTIAQILDRNLNDLPAARQEYRAFLELGGQDPQIEARLAELTQ
ncbi:MAG: hypothetical protein IPK72_04945 [Candidatus Eisenbacteria bacterium]|nr:hypothetical protein [Candidatus Eisenbacteria bacterium]